MNTSCTLETRESSGTQASDEENPGSMGGTRGVQAASACITCMHNMNLTDTPWGLHRLYLRQLSVTDSAISMHRDVHTEADVDEYTP